MILAVKVALFDKRFRLKYFEVLVKSQLHLLARFLVPLFDISLIVVSSECDEGIVLTWLAKDEFVPPSVSEVLEVNLLFS